jgi:hypothetical protein
MTSFVSPVVSTKNTGVPGTQSTLGGESDGYAWVMTRGG